MSEVPKGERSTGREAPPEQLRPHIYVASLADYVNGRLHGEWMDATQPVSALERQIGAMLAASPLAREGESVEEWAIHDTDDFGAIWISEHADLATVAEHARAIAEHGLAYAAWWNLNGMGTSETFVNDYIGEYDSVAAYVEECSEEYGWDSLLDEAVPAYVRAYVSIDYEGIARDMAYSGDIYTAERPDGGVWIFRG